MRITTVSIAGFGLVGQRRYSYLRKIKNIKIEAVSDKFLPYRKKFKEGEIFSNYLEMIKKLKQILFLFVCQISWQLMQHFLALEQWFKCFL